MDASTLDAAPTMPSLEPGVTLLDVDDAATGALQGLVVDRLLAAAADGDGAAPVTGDDGPVRGTTDTGTTAVRDASVSAAGAVWLDSGGRASTRRMHDVVPSPRLLERIRVARAFTPFQHHSAVEDLDDALAPDDALLVLPAVDHFYRAEDLRDGEGREMLASALGRVAALAADRDVPALVTRTGADPLGALVRERADRRIACRATAMGPRFEAPGFETLVYPAGAGAVQTTLAFWRRTLATRWALEGEEPAGAAPAPIAPAGGR